MKGKKGYLLLLPILAVYLYTRIIDLGETSYYLHIKELQTAYDSLCLAHYKTKGVFAPPSLFVYLSAVIMKLKGGLFSLKLFRLLSVAGGMIGLIFSFLTVLELKGKIKYALLEAVLVTVLPVYYVFQRTGIGEYMFLYIAPAAFFFLLKGINTGNRTMYIFSGLFWGAVLLTGSTAHAIVPVCLVFTIAYLIRLKKMSIADALQMGIPVLVCAIILIIGGVESADMSLSNIASNTMNIKGMLWDDRHPYNTVSSFGTVYSLSIPVLIVGGIVSVAGVVSSVKKKQYDPTNLLWIFTVVTLVCDLMVRDASVQTTGPLFFAASLLLVDGLEYISDNLKGTYYIEIATYTVCFVVFLMFYFVNFNSSVNNSTDHEQGQVVDKSIGEAVKASLKTLPDKDISIIADDFPGRNLMIALYGDASPLDYVQFSEEDSYGFGRIRVNTGEDPDESGNTVYIVEQAGHQDVIDALTAQGWGNLYLKEYTICYKQ